MKGTITSVKNQPSKFGGNVYLVTFACEDGKSRRSWIDPKNGNFKRWAMFVQKGKGVSLDGLTIKDDFLINADSAPVETL